MTNHKAGGKTSERHLAKAPQESRETGLLILTLKIREGFLEEVTLV